MITNYYFLSKQFTTAVKEIILPSYLMLSSQFFDLNANSTQRYLQVFVYCNHLINRLFSKILQ
jgi:hypothetical protein